MKNKDIFRELGYVDEKFILEADPTAAEERKSRRGRAAVLIAACFSVVLISLLAVASFFEFGYYPYEETKDLPHYIDNETNETPNDETHAPAATVGKEYIPLINAIKNHTNGGRTDYSSAGDISGATNVGSNQKKYIEVTDNQVEGVIEADNFKRTETHVFYFDVKEDVLIVYATRGEKNAPVSRYEFDFDFLIDRDHLDLYEMFLTEDGKTLSVIAGFYDAEEHYGGNSAINKTILISLDVSDPSNITQKKMIIVSGYYVTSRVVEGKIYLFTDFLIHRYKLDYTDETQILPQIDEGNGFKSLPIEDIVFFDEGPARLYTVITCVDEESFEIENVCALLGSGINEIFVTKDRIFLVDNYAKYVERKEDGENYVDYKRFADISVFSIEKRNVEYLDRFTIEGSVEGQYSIDEYQGVLRIAATTNLHTWVGDVWLEDGKLKVGGGFDPERDVTRYGTNAALYCIDAETWTVVAEVKDFAPWWEYVASARFEGDKAYICTADMPALFDPVYFFDLSDINNITYTDTGIIEGYSTSLINFGDGVLIGIGYGDSRSLKIEAYAETVGKVEAISAYIKEDVSFSDDYKAYYIDRERGLIGLMFHQKKKCTYILLQFDGNKFNEALSVEFEDGSASSVRATTIDGYFYIFVYDQFKAIKLS